MQSLSFWLISETHLFEQVLVEKCSPLARVGSYVGRLILTLAWSLDRKMAGMFQETIPSAKHHFWLPVVSFQQGLYVQLRYWTWRRNEGANGLHYFTQISEVDKVLLFLKKMHLHPITSVLAFQDGKKPHLESTLHHHVSVLARTSPLDSTPPTQT